MVYGGPSSTSPGHEDDDDMNSTLLYNGEIVRFEIYSEVSK